MAKNPAVSNASDSRKRSEPAPGGLTEAERRIPDYAQRVRAGRRDLQNGLGVTLLPPDPAKP